MNKQKNQHRPGVSGNPAKRAATAAHLKTTGHSSVTIGDWVHGARLRTLPLAFAPVIAGAGIASMVQEFSWPLTLLALAVAVLLQIGVNYANDYSDGVRGTDEFRVGPARLTASGLVNPKKVLAVALGCFALAALAGLVAVVLSGRWWFLVIGVLAIIAAWFYTGGKRPYGYMALGEVMVFIFFGLVATAGTYYLQSDIANQQIWWVAGAIGCFAVAVLIANNIRDIPTDRQAGKRTLAVVIGDRAARILFVLFALAPFLVSAVHTPFFPRISVSFLVLLIVLPTCLIVLTAKTARELILALQLTSIAALAYAILIAWGFGL
ncbi:1,4-dihydroxy-2-naphthoate polyprenyltransferase [Canibacter zhoujuaniae]|uniref:1,4-dihydroxy-2-naphthoate polyprenyltransferase n=1 Tax=Canibacter zhoujuaniae TaxID=2708343 RepID=UPI00142431FF|nr:1,4-dihydroxy-2-naphthoate polyprenyltransferase [Canibacter zhoujuaniae]